MFKYKNWALFLWAIKRLKIDSKNDNNIYKKCIKNYILLWRMDLSGVTPADVPYMLQQIDDEIKRRES